MDILYPLVRPRRVTHAEQRFVLNCMLMKSPQILSGIQAMQDASSHVQGSLFFDETQMIAKQTSSRFFPPCVYLRFCKTNIGTSQKPNRCNIEAWGNQLQFDKGNSVDAAPTSFSTTLVWLTSIWSAASLRKVEHTSMLQLLPFKDATK